MRASAQCNVVQPDGGPNGKIRVQVPFMFPAQGSARRFTRRL